VERVIRFSRNGPLVDELLPRGAEATGPVSLKWLGAYQGGWLTALLGIDRAGSAEQFRQALRPWHVPTFSVVFAEVDSSIGYQAAGRIPIRASAERAYRPGWDPDHQWQGLIPFESMPAIANPPRGWIATANHRLAPDDFPYRLFGCWSSGWRGRRVRQMIESRPQLAPQDMAAMQLDARSLRAAELVPHLVMLLERHPDGRVGEAARLLRDWDFQSRSESVAAAIFNVFFTTWCHCVARQRFADDAAELMAGAAAGLAGRLLEADLPGWFAHGGREARVADAFQQALDVLAQRLGPDMRQWTWGQLHQMPLKHVLSARGDLSLLLDHGGGGVQGDMVTVCNTGSGPEWLATSGAGYRMVADLSRQPPVLQAIDAQSQSGHPGSDHYSDQLETWRQGGYHEIPLGAPIPSTARLMLEPH
jgi:penicillin amidase